MKEFPGLLALALTGLLPAQEYRATVQGSVSDPAGAAVPRVVVAITNIESGVSRRSETNLDGIFQIPYLLPGGHGLEITHPGFKTHRRGPIETSTPRFISVSGLLPSSGSMLM
jgi:hypothetical protein